MRSDYGNCRGCDVQVRWAKQAKSGAPTPLTEDDERGNVMLDGLGRAHMFADHAGAVAAMDDPDMPIGQTYLIHHAVCPARAENRERAERQAAQQALL